MEAIEREFAEDCIKLDLAVAAAGGDLALLRPLGQKRIAMLRAYAEKLIKLGYPQLLQSYLGHFDFDEEPRYGIFPVWTVSGTPSKAGRPLAQAWMSARGRPWNGRTEELREEIETAILEGKTIPRFGLSISLTVVQRNAQINYRNKDSLTDDLFTAKLREIDNILDQVITDKWPRDRKLR